MPLSTSTLALVIALSGSPGGSSIQAPQEGSVPIKIQRYSPLREIVADLAKASGLALEVRGEIADYPVYVSYNGNNPRELMNRLATLVGAEWIKPTTGPESLSRSTAFSRKIEREADLVKAAAIDTRLKEMEAQFAKDGPITAKLVEDTRKKQSDRAAEMLKQFENTSGAFQFNVRDEMSMGAGADPTSRALTKVFRAIGSEALSTLKAGQRVVLSTRPTSVQGKLPSNAGQIFREFVRDQQVLQSTRQQNRPASREDGAVQIAFGGAIPGGMGKGNPNKPELGMVVLHRQFGDTITCSLLVADDKGETITQGSTMFPIFEGATSFKTEKKTPYVANPLAKDLATALPGAGGMMGGVRMIMAGSTGSSFSFGGSGESKAVSGAILAQLSQVPTVEPWALLTKPLLDSVATGRNVIALFPDSTFASVAAKIAKGGKDCEAVLGQIDAESGIVVSEKEGWLEVSATSVSAYDEAYVDRPALGKLVKAIVSKGYGTLDDYAGFAVEQIRPLGASTFAQAIVSLVTQDGTLEFGNSLSQETFPWVRLYGTLNPEQRRMLSAKTPISLASLSGTQMEIVRSLTYNDNSGPQRSKPGGDSALPMGLSNMPMVSTIFGGGLSLAGERTVFLGQGVPPRGVLKMDLTTRKTWQARESGTGRTAFGGPELVAMNSFYDKAPAELKRFLTKTSYDRFRAATEQDINLTIQYDPTTAMSNGLKNRFVDASRDYTYAQMPQEFKNQAEEMSKAMGNIQMGVRQRPAKINP